MRAAPAAALALALAACGGAPLRPAGLPQRLELAAVPFHPQELHECGPAALATVLGASGVAADPAALADEVYLPGRHGSLQVELVAALRRHGRLGYVLEPEPAALYAELGAGRPVLVLQNFGSYGHPLWHYAVVIGYEPGHLLLRSGRTARQRLVAARFFASWSRAGRWAVVTLRPGELPADARPRRYLEAASALEGGPAAAAEAAFLAATRRWPAEPAGWLGLGTARRALGEPLAAEQAFRAALALDAHDVAARNNLADTLAARGCLAAARREAGRAAGDAAGTALAALAAATLAELPPAGAAEPADCPAP